MATVWTFPGEENRRSNPFTATLVDELRDLGHMVASPSWRIRFTGKCDIVHLHWPQKVIQNSLLASLRTIAAWWLFLALQKARGACVIWTVHNVVSHEGLHPRLERWWMMRLIAILDGLHALSQVSLDEAAMAYPAISTKQRLIAPHWTYGDAYPPPPPIPAFAPRTIAFLGDLKPYKGLSAFLQALEQAQPDQRRYVVHGRPRDEADRVAIAARLSNLLKRGWNIDFVLERLSDQELVDRLAEAGLLVLPYERGENSGLAVLAAERGTPLLVSALPAFEPLLHELGEGRVSVIAPPLSHAQIETAFEHALPLAGKIDAGFLAARAPANVVREISNYYLFLMDHRLRSAEG